MAPLKEEARKYTGSVQALRPNRARTRTLYFPFWVFSMAQTYSFADDVVLVGTVFLSFPLTAMIPEVSEPVWRRPLVPSRGRTSILLALDLFMRIGMLLSFGFIPAKHSSGWKVPVIRSGPAGFGAGSADRNILANRGIQGNRELEII
jgi:hypothetical protein